MSESFGWSPYTLPSCGVLYKTAEGEPQLPEGTVEVRPMRVGEEALLLEGSPDFVNQVIQRCCRLPNGAVQAGLNHDNLLITDRFSILIAIRALSIPHYTFDWKCPECGHKNKARVNLFQDFDTITPDTVFNRMRDKNVDGFVYAEPFTVELKETKLQDGESTRLGFRFLRATDEEALKRAQKKARLSNTPSGDYTRSAYLYRLSLQMVELNGKPITARQKEELLSGALSFYDARLIEVTLQELETGIDLRLPVTCESPPCRADSLIPMPADLEFFRPTNL